MASAKSAKGSSSSSSRSLSTESRRV
uniref:Uncharacterized protein n=1 Tax=Arundo donax TaxID=35708 RepID=A0A0A9EVV8_ARUDO